MIQFDYDLDQIIKKAKYWCTNIFETSELTPIHILYAIIKDEANIVYNIFWEMGVAVELLSEELKKAAHAQKQNIDTKDVYTSKSLEAILHNSLSKKVATDKKLTLSDVMLGLLEVKNECTDIFKTYNINKKDFLKIYNSYLSYSDNFIVTIDQTHYNGDTQVNSQRKEKPSPDDTIISKYCRDLSLLATKKKLNNVYGREKEMNDCLEALNKTQKKNILLIGEAGVGKTSIVEGLAHKIKNKKIYELDLNKLVAGTKFRGDLENRLAKLLDYLTNNDCILFIDEVHSLKNAGMSEDGLSLINVFKPAMARGEIQLILATTNRDYTIHLEDDRAFSRRCTIIQVAEPDKKNTLNILKQFAKKHNFLVSDVLLNEIYDFSKKHIINRVMPDKAIDILDLCYAKASLNNNTGKTFKLEKDLHTLLAVKNELFAEGNLELSKEIQSREKELRAALSKEKQQVTITESLLNAVIKDTYNLIAQEYFTAKSFKQDVLWFNNRIIGQGDVITNMIKSYYGHNMGEIKKPFNSFLMGNSGMGKTSMAEYFAEKYYDSNILTINCAEYKEGHSISNLIGSPAGYIRSNEGGQLINYVDKHPRCVILFDEIEEAHPDIYALLLQILDKGILTDRKSIKANFLNCSIFFTSNIGVKELSSKISFNKENNLDKHFLEGILSKKFEKKFLNRINNFAYFNNLVKEDYELLITKRIEDIRKNFKNKISMRINKQTINHIADKCEKDNLGVRQLNKIIDDEIYNPLVMAILDGETKVTL